jgi:LuxR family maltose regulon positive regulatory protein
LHQAKRECLEGLRLAERIGGRTFQAGYLHYILFEVAFAWNRLEEASDSRSFSPPQATPFQWLW